MVLFCSKHAISSIAANWCTKAKPGQQSKGCLCVCVSEKQPAATTMALAAAWQRSGRHATRHSDRPASCTKSAKSPRGQCRTTKTCSSLATHQGECTSIAIVTSYVVRRAVSMVMQSAGQIMDACAGTTRPATTCTISTRMQVCASCHIPCHDQVHGAVR
jgi:hypothetical protein